MTTTIRKMTAAQIAAIPGHDRLMFQVSLRILVARRAILKVR